jgi:hypothetical protein
VVGELRRSKMTHTGLRSRHYEERGRGDSVYVHNEYKDNRRGGPDYNDPVAVLVLAVMIILVCFGLVTLFAPPPGYGYREYRRPPTGYAPAYDYPSHFSR